MMTFKKFFEQAQIAQQAPDFNRDGISDDIHGVVAPTALSQGEWKASKEQILQYWKSIRNDSPIVMRPIEYEHKGSTYGEDGVRITGNPQFISSVLARLKDFLVYETPTTKLVVSYRQTESPSKLAAGEGKTSYVFYIAAKERGQKMPRKMGL
jgi:hypothetical protein